MNLQPPSRPRSNNRTVQAVILLPPHARRTSHSQVASTSQKVRAPRSSRVVHQSDLDQMCNIERVLCPNTHLIRCGPRRQCAAAQSTGDSKYFQRPLSVTTRRENWSCRHCPKPKDDDGKGGIGKKSELPDSKKRVFEKRKKNGSGNSKKGSSKGTSSSKKIEVEDE